LSEDAQAQLKIMTEDRDSYAAKYRAMCQQYCMFREMEDATVDETELVAAFISKLMGEGREHGELCHETDTRSVQDLMTEAVDELVDSLSYVLMAQRRVEMGL